MKVYSKIAVAVVTLGLVVGVSNEVYADSQPSSGEVSLDKPAKNLLKATQKVGGGTWKHWMTGDMNYSEYYHSTRQHSTTVKNSTGRSVSSGWVAKGKWAKASCKASLSGNKAYWNTK
ncbi:lactococcin 972 family bacteriocin [Listeria ilorinensis]|uniref:lactococcin 972 family bacteriocin n=1 Tax=Listeria ilorinensis TaxID=2867439 RepID=UPI001EF51F82|nr:lactococcin 972 family bacteriocin [Listeria ilorinensis]